MDFVWFSLVFRGQGQGEVRGARCTATPPDALAERSAPGPVSPVSYVFRAPGGRLEIILLGPEDDVCCQNKTKTNSKGTNTVDFQYAHI